MKESEILEQIEDLVTSVTDDEEAQEQIRKTATKNYEIYKKLAGSQYQVKQEIKKTDEGYQQVLTIDGISEKEIYDLERNKEKMARELGWEEV